MGIVYLFQSPSIRPHIRRVLCYPRLSTVTHENNLLSEVELFEFHFLFNFCSRYNNSFERPMLLPKIFKSDSTNAMVNPFRDLNSCVTKFGS